MINKILLLFMVFSFSLLKDEQFGKCMDLYENTFMKIFDVTNSFHNYKRINLDSFSDFIQSTFDLVTKCHNINEKNNSYFNCSKKFFLDLDSVQRILRSIFMEKKLNLAKLLTGIGNFITDLTMVIVNCKKNNKKDDNNDDNSYKWKEI